MILVNIVELNGGRNAVKMSEKIYIAERFPLNSEKAVIWYATNYQEELKLNRTNQLLSYADDVNIVAENTDTIKKTGSLQVLVRRLV
jgi:hypothetical protein